MVSKSVEIRTYVKNGVLYFDSPPSVFTKRDQILHFIDLNGFVDMYDLTEAFQMSHGGIRYHLRKLEQLGDIEIELVSIGNRGGSKIVVRRVIHG